MANATGDCDNAWCICMANVYANSCSTRHKQSDTERVVHVAAHAGRAGVRGMGEGVRSVVVGQALTL